MDVLGRLEQALRVGVQTGMHLARYLSPEPSAFWTAVREVEEDPIFLKVWGARLHGGRRPLAIVPRRAFPAGVAATGHPLAGPEVEALLVGFEDVIARLRTLGRGAFVSCFLENEGVTLAELADATGIDLDELQRFRKQVVDRILIADIVGGSSGTVLGGARKDLDPIGRVVVMDGHLHLEPYFDRARYRVDERAVQEALTGGVLSGEELGRWHELRRRIGWINTRFNLVNRLVEIVCRAQEPYLLSGRADDLAVLEMKGVAAELGLHPSWICRLASRRSLLAPAGEIPLRDLFQDRRQALKAHGKRELRALLREGEGLSDRQLQEALHLRGVKVARRTVNAWRKELRA